MPYRKKGDVTMKERKFIKKLVEGKGKRQAVLEVYNTKSDITAKNMAKQILKRPIVQEYLKEILDRKGLSLEDLGDKLYSAIDNNLKNGKASQAVGAGLLQFAYKIHDAIPSTKSVSTNLNVNANATPDSMHELTEMLRTITEQNAQLLKEMQK